MNEQNKEITSNNLIRIKDEKVVDTLNEMYEKTKNTYQSKNKFFNDIIKLGVQVLQKQEKDNWAIQNEKQTLLDAIHEYTKRMNYFIKFSKPFIQTTYANSEVNQQLMCVILNYFFSKMEVYEKNKFYKNLDLFKVLPKNFEEEKYKLKHDYLNEIE